MTHTTQLACTCGRTALEVEGAPIVSAECHCNSCRAAGVRLSALPSAPFILRANGGTHFVLYRKDRVRFLKGIEGLKAFRLSPEAGTRRVVATCCNTPIFLEFSGSHWLSLYACLWRGQTLPPLDLRTMTGDLPDRSLLSDDVPNPKGHSISFMARLLGAWIAMGFKNPKITFVQGEIPVGPER